jgi:hypothetical protein
MGTKYIVDNLSGQTINGNPIDPKYKVFTALLTQSGVDDFQSGVEFSLVIGRTYTFDNSLTGDNFSNVGGPNITEANTYDGYSFVATGTTPISWIGGSTLTWNTGAPVATVLENTVGNIFFGYFALGLYTINSDNLFTNNKFALFMGNMVLEPDVNISCTYGNSSTVYMNVVQASNSVDGELSNTPIEIRVYN